MGAVVVFLLKFLEYHGNFSSIPFRRIANASSGRWRSQLCEGSIQC